MGFSAWRVSLCLSFFLSFGSLMQQEKKFFMETNDSSDTRNVGLEFSSFIISKGNWKVVVQIIIFNCVTVEPFIRLIVSQYDLIKDHFFIFFPIDNYLMKILYYICKIYGEKLISRTNAYLERKMLAIFHAQWVSL